MKPNSVSGRGGLLAVLCLTATAGLGAPLSDPEVDRYNLRVGTQTFSPRYQFTGQTKLVETADAIRGMGSDVVKFGLSKSPGGYGISLPSSITNLLSLAKNEPSYRHVFDSPFRHYLLWIYCFASTSDAWWKNGFTTSERQAEYNEVYAFTRYLLTNYNHSGKSFYLGHWEGDWYLLDNYVTTNNPSPTAIQGMRDWLNTRQQAVDDARRDTAHTNVDVYVYTEANRVRDAMLNGTNSNQRVINTVVPYVTNLDFVSWSSYDGQNLNQTELFNTLDYIESMLPTNKAASIQGRRTFIGEYGWGGSLSSAAQEPPTRAYIRKHLEWGSRFVLFWEMYNNEVDGSGNNRAYWLIDDTGAKTPCYFLHQRFYNQARLLLGEFKQDHGRLPDDAEFAALATMRLDQPLPEPISLLVSNDLVLGASPNGAEVRGTVRQGLYGDERAALWVYWGATDGGTNRGSWQRRTSVGLNNRFGPARLRATLPNLEDGVRYYFRFYASNATTEAWAPDTASFRHQPLDQARYQRRMKISFTGYTRAGALRDFPALVLLGTNRPGFAYHQFAAANGADLRFTDASGLRLIPHEVDEWHTNGASAVWVRVPELAGSNDCVWAWWGNPNATNVPDYTTHGAVWLPQHEMVWHLKEAGWPYADSTGRHPALSGTAPVPVGGVVGRGQSFNGSSHYLNAGVVDGGERFTLSAWAWIDPAAHSIQTLFGSKNGGAATDGLAFFVHSYQTRDQRLLLETGNGTSGLTAATQSGVVSTNRWQHLAAVVDRPAGRTDLYVDGTLLTLGGAIRTDFGTNRTLRIGRFPDGGYPLRGRLDEVRLARGRSSPDWLWASWMTVASNNTFVSTAPAETPPAVSMPQTLISTGAVWRFHDTGADLGTGWRAASYDDGSWSAGPAQLGYGDGDETTLVLSNRARITTYFRRTFVAPAPENFAQMVLRVLRDDGAVVYLNGAEVFRSNMPTGAVNHLTFASSAAVGADETNRFHSMAVNPQRLAAGTNVLAVEVHQNGTNSSDLSFDLELVGYPAEALPRLTLARNASELWLRWPTSEVALVLHETPSLPPASGWQPATNGLVLTPGQAVVPVSVTNRSRFFRLEGP